MNYTSRSGFFPILYVVFILLSSAVPLPAEDEKPAPLVLRIQAEGGCLSVLRHTISVGPGGTTVNYRQDCGQDRLFPFTRFALETVIRDRHRVILMYQPIFLETGDTLKRDITVDSVTFASGTVMDYKYDFPFWRLSYMYDLFPGPGIDLELGGSLQLRDAEYTFKSRDGTQRVRKGGMGPVPLFKVRGRYAFRDGFWAGGEADFIYAPVSYLNGSDREVTGALGDIALRAGKVFGNFDFFVSARYLAGGATNEEPNDRVKNWLQFMIFSAGVTCTVYGGEEKTAEGEPEPGITSQ